MLTLFVGVMSGTQAANQGVSVLSTQLAKQALKKLPQQALTKGVLYTIVKKVAHHLGAQMTKQLFAKSVAKVIPVVGAVLSGGLTYVTFLPTCRKLKKHLRTLELTKPRTEPSIETPNVALIIDDNGHETTTPVDPVADQH